MFKALCFIAVNIALIAVFIRTMRRRNFLSFFQDGRWWLTWFAIAIITLMDELTSIYYAPFEAYRFIGLRAIVYIAVTSLFIRVISTRMVEIAEILEVNNVKGGGVYSFSYMVLGPSMSFIAAASILVVYVLTAAMSTVSAVQNGTTFIEITEQQRYVTEFVVVWLIAGLNILGIRENAKFTFSIFVVGALVLVNLIVGGVFSITPESVARIREGVRLTVADVKGVSFFAAYGNIIAGIGSCILAYSGVESVLQTASFSKSWHSIRRAYLFLALTVGVVTPLIAALAISSTPDIESKATDLIPSFAALANGYGFGVIVSVLASITLIMAVNTAMVASAELIEKIAEKYRFNWLIRLNRRQSLYRVHIFNALFYSAIIFITSGSQELLAQMYAVGLVASFAINMFSLLVYKYAKGTKEISSRTSRLGTLMVLVLLLSVFAFIASHRLYGTALWLGMALLFLVGGLRISKYRGPEIPVRRASSSPMDVVFALAGMPSREVHLYLSRPREDVREDAEKSVYVSFYMPRLESPPPESPNRFWISIQNRARLFDMIVGLLETLSYDLPPEKKLHVHFGWPLSSWLDRMSIGVMVFNIINLPKRFPRFEFHIDYRGAST